MGKTVVSLNNSCESKISSAEATEADRSYRGPSQWPLVESEPWSCLRSGWGCWGWRWIKNQGAPRFVYDCTFHIWFYLTIIACFVYLFIWLFITTTFLSLPQSNMERLILLARWVRRRSHHSIGLLKVEASILPRLDVGKNWSWYLHGFTRNVGIPQIHPNPTCGRCWYCDTSFTAKQKAGNVVCVSVIASLSPFVLSRQAMIIDLLSIRADRDNYYYGCDPSSFEELLSQDITSFIIFHHLSSSFNFFFSKCKSQVFLHLSRDPDSENWQWLSRDPLGDDLFRRHPEVVHKLCTGLSVELWQLVLCVQNLYRCYIFEGSLNRNFRQYGQLKSRVE